MNIEYKIYCSFKNENGDKGFLIEPFIMRLNNNELEFKSPSYLKKGETIYFDVPHIINGQRKNYFIKIFIGHNIMTNVWTKADIDSDSIGVLKEGFIKYEKEIEELENILKSNI